MTQEARAAELQSRRDTMDSPAQIMYEEHCVDFMLHEFKVLNCYTYTIKDIQTFIDGEIKAGRVRWTGRLTTVASSQRS